MYAPEEVFLRKDLISEFFQSDPKLASMPRKFQTLIGTKNKHLANIYFPQEKFAISRCGLTHRSSLVLPRLNCYAGSTPQEISPHGERGEGNDNNEQELTQVLQFAKIVQEGRHREELVEFFQSHHNWY